MKKFLASTIFIALFATYTLYLHANTQIASASNTTDTEAISAQTSAQTTASPQNASTDSTTQAAAQTATQTNTTVAAADATPSPTPASTPTVSTTATTPADVPKGQYKDGTYTGSSENAFYGDVQVQVTVSGGKITDVAFLSYPSDRRQSEEINSRAMPVLKQEAISAQSAQVDGVSGATDTSEAFVQSLASALSSAKA
jgi:uncharacterized protein with FMN-binding domain